MSKKALVVVSFGTSYLNAHINSLEPIENQLAAEHCDYDFYRAFTSQMVINKLSSLYDIHVKNLTDTFELLESEGYTEVLCQPTHVIAGYEYEKIISVIKKYEPSFNSIKLGYPLLNDLSDYQEACDAVIKTCPQLKANEALLLMGHGSHHRANHSYTVLAKEFNSSSNNIFVAAVEGDLSLAKVIKHLPSRAISKVYLMPFMIVFGDHAQNDLAGDEMDSWKSVLSNQGYEVEVINKSLGEIKEIRDIFIKHSLKAKL